jgi:hypothetical protein
VGFGRGKTLPVVERADEGAADFGFRSSSELVLGSVAGFFGSSSELPDASAPVFRRIFIAKSRADPLRVRVFGSSSELDSKGGFFASMAARPLVIDVGRG